MCGGFCPRCVEPTIAEPISRKNPEEFRVIQVKIQVFVGR
ncbi:hypothetical protein AM1_A0288 (plasmid) [Acaryochloris marina MBIC11017]|uniref:Uncharacterized protein n=1 Tax=Acaryochloris marina (strain MBIC 11017) TaxID=329726 RepID=A8ZKT8_ACAM1|nr:hypothetical protein AM1_A0288 [Acaryochloris marina MBIC11017]